MAKKIINSPDDTVPEMMEGFIAAHNRYYEKVSGVNGVLLRQRRKDKVTLVIGGGSGHEPMFSGFVGKGLADAAACGNIFASPDPGTICETARAAHGGKGILFIYGNYAGDNLNFDMAEEMLQDEGIKTRHVRVWDDCASAPPERIEDRRGIAGDVFVVKIAGAACDAGLSLDETVSVAENVRVNLRTIGVATSPGQIPGSDQPAFLLGENEIEYGMGLHGEPGIERTTMKPADELVDIMYQNLVRDMPLKGGDEVCVLVNGLGSTTIMEMSIVYRRVKQLLDAGRIVVYDADINSYCTCMEMGGFSISILKLDAGLKKYYNAPCYCPYFAREGR
jgi:dihydroxyacetone kinase-like protein